LFAGSEKEKLVGIAESGVREVIEGRSGTRQTPK
jgi:hypothetical protein